MPEGLYFVRSSPEWTEQTVPQNLLRTHRLGHGTWGRIAVHTGNMRFIMSTEPPIDAVLGPGSSQAVPPEVDHEVRLMGSVRFTIDFLAVFPRRPAMDRESKPGAGRPSDSVKSDAGGDPACWAALLCSECGAVLDGGAHHPDCQRPGALR